MRSSCVRIPSCQQCVSSNSQEIIHYTVIVAHSGDHVAIDVHGHRYARMAQKLLHTLWVLTFHEPDGSTRVPEIMEPYSR
jgi:hypothetical protein